jgi:hypothetical protein
MQMRLENNICPENKKKNKEKERERERKKKERKCLEYNIVEVPITTAHGPN